MPGTQLTADANFAQRGDARIIGLLTPDPVVSHIRRGSIVMFDSNGKIVPVPENDGATNNADKRVAGQAIESTLDPLFDVNAGLNVRTDTEVQLNILAGQTIKVGTLVYMTSDNEITNTAALNPKAGIVTAVMGTVAFVKLSLDIPS